jgi:hypothetical protein
VNGTRIVVIVGLGAAAWMGRGLVMPESGTDEVPPAPIARHVELEPTDVVWEPTEDVRDPFAPLVLPAAGAENPAVG